MRNISKLDLNEIIDKEYINKYGEKFKVLNYLFKEKNNHCYDIEFLETHNRQMATLNQIRNGTCRDIVERKKVKRLKVELQLRERNKLVAKAKKVCVIPSNLHEKNVLAIDLSSSSTGIAYSQRGQIVRWMTIKPHDNSNFRERGLEIVEKIAQILKTGKIDYIILEDVFLGLNSDVLCKLSEVRGMLMYHIKKLGIEFLLIPAVLWKHKYNGMPAARQEQKKFIMDKFFEYTGEVPDSDDVADAYCILRACINTKSGEN